MSNAKPNIILINVDDMGYGDLGCYGSDFHKTPYIDKLAAEGRRFTDFYMAAPVCTPSRAAMMTGCYPRRVGLSTGDHGAWVLFPGHSKGLSDKETTVASILKDQGYKTHIIGKWHLGDQPEYYPTRHGFDGWYGMPYSNDMGIMSNRPDYPPLPIMHNEEVVQEQPDQASVTERYVENAVHFMRENKDQPFFLYFAHMYVHRPCYAPERFVMKSQNGRYGACVECVDWSTGALMQELDDLGLTDNTIVMFTSDNGAEGEQSRSCRPLRGHKGTTWEGGQRLPFIVRWPARIPAGTECSEIITSMDLLPTLANITGGQVPTDRKIDGKDVTPLFLGEEGAKTPHEAFFYYLIDKLEAVRSGKWKLHLERRELYDLEADISESNNIIDEHPDVVERLEALAQACREDIGDSLKEMEGANCRQSGKVENPKTITETDLNHPYVIAMYDLDGGYSSLEESDDLGELIQIMTERREQARKERIKKP